MTTPETETLAFLDSHIIILDLARELSRRLRLADARIAELEDEVGRLKGSAA